MILILQIAPTEQLIGQMTREARGRNSAASRTGQQSIQSLAVLPPENLSSDPDQEYFAEGMTGCIDDRLGRSAH